MASAVLAVYACYFNAEASATCRVAISQAVATNDGLLTAVALAQPLSLSVSDGHAAQYEQSPKAEIRHIDQRPAHTLVYHPNLIYTKAIK